VLVVEINLASTRCLLGWSVFVGDALVLVIKRNQSNSGFPSRSNVFVGNLHVLFSIKKANIY